MFWRPMSDAEMLYRRAVWRTQTLLLPDEHPLSRLGRRTDREVHEAMSCVYGMFQAFQCDAIDGALLQPTSDVKRDRPLFKKYVPLCKRVAEAGCSHHESATPTPHTRMGSRGRASDRIPRREGTTHANRSLSSLRWTTCRQNQARELISGRTLAVRRCKHHVESGP